MFSVPSEVSFHRGSGNIVNEIVADYQDETNGGNGYLRIYVFNPALNEIDAYTYSPSLDSFNTNANNQFVMQTTPITPTQTPEQDFAARCAAAVATGGKCVGFENAADFFNNSGNGAWGYNTGVAFGNFKLITQDFSVKASGSSSIRFSVPSNSGSSLSGYWFTNFSNPVTDFQVSAGQDYYAQWRVRYSPEMFNQVFWAQAAWTSQYLLLQLPAVRESP